MPLRKGFPLARMESHPVLRFVQNVSRYPFRSAHCQ